MMRFAVWTAPKLKKVKPKKTARVEKTVRVTSGAKIRLGGG